jgi:hypothetical protein
VNYELPTLTNNIFLALPKEGVAKNISENSLSRAFDRRNEALRYPRGNGASRETASERINRSGRAVLS